MENYQNIELYLKELANTKKDKFPDMNGDYWERYTSLTSYLRQFIYKHINSGLACLSKSPGLYTDHGESHFDEVIRYADLLTETSAQRAHLNPYELYLLLCAIRLHDAGNIDGREEHERRTNQILTDVGGPICSDPAEFDLICKIAEAHGGRTDNNDKDTIGQLPETTDVSCISCRPRLVAALVRFADEICEHRGRTSQHHLRTGNIPEANKLYHFYAESIRGAKPDRQTKSFSLTLSIKAAYLSKKYKTPFGNQEKYLFDEIVERITKLESERLYCNQFLDPALQTDRLCIKIMVSSTHKVGNKEFPVDVPLFQTEIPQRKGYPDLSLNWVNKKEFSGKTLAIRAKREKWI